MTVFTSTSNQGLLSKQNSFHVIFLEMWKIIVIQLNAQMTNASIISSRECFENTVVNPLPHNPDF